MKTDTQTTNWIGDKGQFKMKDGRPVLIVPSEPAPNKAQHSPLPWICHEGRIWHWNGKPNFVAATDKRDASFLQVNGNAEANADLIVRAVNNADKLAECLRALTKEIKLGTLNIRKDFSLMNAHACATKALHEYDNGSV